MIYPNGGTGSRFDNDWAYGINRLPEDEDIIAVFNPEDPIVKAILSLVKKGTEGEMVNPYHSELGYK